MQSVPVTSPSPPTESTLPHAVQTLVSFLLFVHFFALLVAIGSGAFRSALFANLRRVPGVVPYLQLLNFDLPYSYHLTYGETLDFDHSLTGELVLPNNERKSVTLPEPGLWPHQRYQRYQRLALNAATLVDDDNSGPILPTAVSSYWMHKYGAESVDPIRCQAHLPESVARGNIGDPEALPTQPFRDVTRYEGRAWLSQGRVDFLKTESAQDTAPAAGASQGNVSQPPASDDQRNSPAPGPAPPP